ncbi:ABC-2 type transport system permease protein [Sphingomonas jinjuensis]|uniref:ABC-2 type transport system permease protein n=1 Tax=Sphingomonas jinjuensis TaxID=535907 RepID=A0A840F6R3_9SPHN|nr:ABC transporter permease [Sphingomonas jinjuensis]MBB4154963.1 ABC-2 type transport system permease protein [Sphingomonas jinjuensis]
MTRFRRSLRQTLTIARRDFTATVFTPVFLLFLFAPLIIGSFSAIGGMGAASVAGPSDKARIVIVTPDRYARPLAEADTRLRAGYRRDETPPELTTITERTYPQGQARAAFRSRDYDAVAVMYGPLDKPTVLYGPLGKTAANYLGLLAGQALAAEKLGGAVPSVTLTKVAMTRERASTSGRNQSAFFAVFGIFFLTLFLAGQVVGTMAEERNNKVIEVLAAAVPLESVFLGKLIGMFGVALLFVGFWGTVVGKLGSLLPAGAAPALAELAPAIGGPTFAILFAAYFATAYLLLGSVFLGIGAQASTPREIQMLSLPITLVQVGCFALASAAASRPGSGIALAAEIFPLSSPFAMAGRAANSPVLWPHLLAIAWQLVWVAIFIAVGARLFRRGVLQSGSVRPFWKRGKS